MKIIIISLFTLISIFLSSCNKDAVVLDIKSLFFEKETLFFGNAQDIIIVGLPDSTLSVTNNGDGFTWKLNTPVYVKFNDNNPNAIDYDSIQKININGNIFSKIQLDNILQERFEKNNNFLEGNDWNYILLADVLKIINNQNNDAFDSLNTLIAYTKDDKKLILLDKNITVNDSCIFKDTGVILGSRLKIEFFRTFHSDFLSSKNKNYFHKGDTCFISSVKSYYTPFGANETTLINENKMIKASFNKLYRAVIPKEAIKNTYNKNEKIPISLRQILYANTYSNELYIPNLSNPEYWKFGTINPDKNYELEVEEKNPLWEGEYKSYLIDWKIFLKGLSPLFFVFIIGLYILFSTTRNPVISESKYSDNTRWRSYFIILYFLLFILSIARIFIGYNLSFTSPFAIYTFPTAIIVSPLILLCVLLFWVAFLCMEFNFKGILGEANWKKLLLLIPISGVIIGVIYFLSKFCLGEIFTFYWSDIFDWSKVNPFSDEKLVYGTTIWGLVVLSLLLTQLAWKKKFKGYNIAKILIIILLVLISILFLFQQSAISVTLLLVCVFLFGLFNCQSGWNIELRKSRWHRLGKLILFLLPPILVFIIAIIRNDSGYFINLVLFPIIITLILFRYYHFYGYQDSDKEGKMGKKDRNKNTIVSFLVIIFIMVCIFLSVWVITKNYNPFSSHRSIERSVVYFDFPTIEEWGYRITEERAQFFAELVKYSYPSEFNCYEPVHPGISSFIDPVVENDLSVPFGLIYQFGPNWWWVPLALLITIWSILCFYVLKMSLKPKEEMSFGNLGKLPPIYFSTYGIIRIFCMSMILSSGLWLILSYYGIVPFTGRLVYGLGQDSIGEVFETVFLFAFMGLCGIAEDK